MGGFLNGTRTFVHNIRKENNVYKYQCRQLVSFLMGMKNLSARFHFLKNAVKTTKINELSGKYKDSWVSYYYMHSV